MKGVSTKEKDFSNSVLFLILAAASRQLLRSFAERSAAGENARVNPDIQIHDSTHSKEVNTTQLVHDIAVLCERILSQLPQHLIDQGAYITMLAPLSYGFIVVLYTVIALGAAAVPLSTNILPKEGAWFLRKCNAICLLVHP
ncbi:hypothetical protein BJX96DRAFT_176293 [Aspergillus floccosus]